MDKSLENKKENIGKYETPKFEVDKLEVMFRLSPETVEPEVDPDEGNWTGFY